MASFSSRNRRFGVNFYLTCKVVDFVGENQKICKPYCLLYYKRLCYLSPRTMPRSELRIKCTISSRSGVAGMFSSMYLRASLVFIPAI